MLTLPIRRRRKLTMDSMVTILLMVVIVTVNSMAVMLPVLDPVVMRKRVETAKPVATKGHSVGDPRLREFHADRTREDLYTQQHLVSNTSVAMSGQPHCLASEARRVARRHA